MNLFNRIKILLFSGHCFQIVGNIIRLYTTKIFYKIFPKLKYKRDKKLYTINNISYINWFKEKGDFWITKFMESRNIKHKRHIDFFSVFGPKKSINYSKEIKIFFTGEDTSPTSVIVFKGYDDYLLDKTDLSIGFKSFKNDNYIRFPLWIMQLIEPQMSNADIKKRIDDINNRELVKRNKENFCSLVARHDISGNREIVYNKLKDIGKIDCPSYFKHNIDVNLPDYEAKRNFLKKYRYNICMENNLSKGYVTEKLVDALMAHTIPIYYGELDDFDKRIFNEDAILYADNSLYKKVKYLEENKEEYDKLYKIKPFKDGAYKLIIEQLDLLEYKLRNILS